MAENIRSKVEHLRIPHQNSEVGEFVTVSIGVATVVPKHNHDPKHLINIADKALYQAKRNGRNQVQVFKET